MKLSKKERTQTEIIEAAKAIIHNNGHEAITVRNLGELTGYSHTKLYYYFKDLNALLWALRFDMIEDMITELTSTPYQKPDPVEEVLEAFFCYTDYFFKHPNVFRFFYFYPFVPPDGDTRYQMLEQRFQGIWRESFVRLIEEDTIQSKNLELVAKTIIYSLQGMIMLNISANGTAQKEDIKDELTKIVHYLFRRNE